MQCVAKIMSILSVHSLVMIVRIRVLYLIIIIKSEVLTICYCLGLAHEAMVCAVCFLYPYNDFMKLKHFSHHPLFVERIHQLLMGTPRKLTVSGALEFLCCQAAEETVSSPVIWDVMVLIKRDCDVIGIISHTEDICRYKGYLIRMTE